MPVGWGDNTDDINQPTTTWFITSDDPTTSGNDQYNETKSIYNIFFGCACFRQQISEEAISFEVHSDVRKGAVPEAASS